MDDEQIHKDYKYYGNIISSLKSNRPEGITAHKLYILYTLADGGKITKPNRWFSFQETRDVYDLYERFYKKFSNDEKGAKLEYIKVAREHLM